MHTTDSSIQGITDAASSPESEHRSLSNNIEAAVFRCQKHIPDLVSHTQVVTLGTSCASSCTTTDKITTADCSKLDSQF